MVSIIPVMAEKSIVKLLYSLFMDDTISPLPCFFDNDPII